VVCEARRIRSRLLTPRPAKPSRTFLPHQARGAGLPLYYRYRDYAALPNRPPGLPLTPEGHTLVRALPVLPAPPKKGPWKLIASAMARSRPFGSAGD
jgi:hypothetical protein